MTNFLIFIGVWVFLAFTLTPLFTRAFFGWRDPNSSIPVTPPGIEAARPGASIRDDVPAPGSASQAS